MADQAIAPLPVAAVFRRLREAALESPGTFGGVTSVDAVRAIDHVMPSWGSEQGSRPVVPEEIEAIGRMLDEAGYPSAAAMIDRVQALLRTISELSSQLITASAAHREAAAASAKAEEAAAEAQGRFREAVAERNGTVASLVTEREVEQEVVRMLLTIPGECSLLAAVEAVRGILPTTEQAASRTLVRVAVQLGLLERLVERPA